MRTQNRERNAVVSRRQLEAMLDDLVQRIATLHRRETHRLVQELRGHSRETRGREVHPSQWPPLPDSAARVWDLLKDRAMQAKEIAGKLYGHPRHAPRVRKAVMRIRKAGRPIKLTPGVGYWRPDAKPPGVGQAALGA